MSIPDFQSIMLPLLRACGDNREHQFRELVETLADQFALTKEERQTLLPSGRQPLFHNRVAWARTHMVKAGLLESLRRGSLQITSRGLVVLSSPPNRINIPFLRQFREYLEFRNLEAPADDASSERTSFEATNKAESKTPEEILEYAYLQIRADLATEILSRVKSCSPAFFEQLVVEVLVAMGYGGSRKDAGQTVGKSGDGGIDGIIKEDRLGLDVIYIQAKRWESSVSRPEIQKFVGALQGQRARKGVFITTSDYTREAIEYARNLDCKVVLIDGVQLANFMIDYNIGVAGAVTYEVKRMDSDYFAED